jgi:hypothetical protein
MKFTFKTLNLANLFWKNIYKASKKDVLLMYYIKEMKNDPVRI